MYLYIEELMPLGVSRRMFYKGGKKGGKMPKPAPPPAPTPMPGKIDEKARQKDQDKRRQRIVAAGRQGTILTEGQTLSSGSSSILGRST